MSTAALFAVVPIHVEAVTGIVGRGELLVAFLDELLFLADSEELAFDAFLLDVQGTRLLAHLEGGFIIARGKEIKAVTYHRLELRDDFRTSQSARASALSLRCPS